MKIIFKIFSLLIIFVISLWIFMPKVSLYNLAQKELKKQNVIISDEKIVEKSFGLEIKDSNIYFEGIKIAKVNSIDISSYFVYTKLKVTDIEFLDSFKKILPQIIDEVNVIYSITNPKKVELSALSIYGNINGYADLLERKLILELENNTKIKREYPNLLRMMKLVDGRYVYEYNF